jgi:cellulose synthase operon protein C
MTPVGDTSDDSERATDLLRELAVWLQSAEGDQGWLAALRFGAAGGLAEAGETELAEAGFRKIVAENPDHLWAWVGLIDLARARGDTPAAIALGRDAVTRMPSEILLRRKAAEALEAKGEPAAALELMQVPAMDELSAGDGSFTIGLHRAAGTVAEAAGLCDHVLAQHPDDERAHLARIEIALQAADGKAAVAAATAALAHHPQHPEIVLRAAQAHWLAGDSYRALALAQNAPEDPSFAPWFLRLRADVAEETGARDASRRLWTRLRDLDHPELSAEAVAALARLSADAGPKNAPDPPSRPDNEAVEGPPDIETDSGETDPDTDAATLFAGLDAALGEDAAAAEAFLRRLVAHPDLPWYLAFRLVERAWRNGSDGLADRLSAAFDGAPWPGPDRQAFAIEDRLLRRGPRAALDWVRAHPAPRRDAEAAERLGRVLVGAGTGRLAARYLGACCRRWPAEPQILNLATDALIACGAADRVSDLLASAGIGAAQGLASRVSAAMAAGDVEAALDACQAAERAGAGRLPLINMIELHVLAGDLSTAEACAARLSVTDGPLEEAVICRPRATRVGSLLNEARILAASGVDWQAADLPDLAQAAQSFFLPARTLVQRLGPQASTQAAGIGEAPTVPDLIHVIWPGPPPIPDEVERILEEWRARSRRQVTVHDERTAPGWLRERIGADAARAYAMAPEREQKADLMMLAALMVDGGVAIAPSEWPAADIDPVIDAVSGAGFFLDASGAVSTDVVIAVAGHPVLTDAFDRAVASCLTRENDHRWFKTGPGLLTRVLAAGLSGSPETGAPVRLQPLAELRTMVHPHRPYQGASAQDRRHGRRGQTGFVAALSKLLAPDDTGFEPGA